MKKALAIALMAALAMSATGASAQIGRLLAKPLGLPESGVAGGAYRSNNEVRTYITSGPYDGIDLYGKAITKAAEMTQAKGFGRFGVTKYNCYTTLMNNNPVASSCTVIAVMLNEGEEAKPRGKRTVLYYDVGEVLAGTIRRPQQ